jgi:serine/threonine-protein kinase
MTQIDRYRILSTVYEGEYTTVHAALHTVLGSQLALKVLNPGAPAEVGRALLQEGRIQAVVRHPHVLRVADAFEVDGRILLAMEFVKGESLADYIEPGRQPLEVVLPLFKGIVRGVRAIHKRGIVHRDLKPENVLLEPNGKRFRPLVADFGMAKILQPNQQPTPRGLSTSFSFLGTPEYMAPEQAADPGRVDTRADLFSLGALLYELVTGVVCFEAEHDVDVMYRAARADYDPVTAHVDDVPEAIVELVDALLRPKVEARLQSASAVLRVLDRVQG